MSPPPLFLLKLIILIISVSAWLSACGGGGGSAADSTAPAAIITFPPAVSATEGDSIIVRGTATDASEITVVRVNGIDATSSDNFATWQAAVELTPGVNSLTVETGDIALNANMAAASVQINAHGPTFSNTPDDVNTFSSLNSGVVLDSANNRALVVDTGLNALVVVDLMNGQRVFGSR